MELYNKKFVYFDWDDNLKGKSVMTADEIEELKDIVNAGDISQLHSVEKSASCGFPFLINDSSLRRFAYYDPNYMLKLAYKRGATIQFKTGCCWYDCTNEPEWLDDVEYREKPIKYYCGIANLENRLVRTQNKNEIRSVYATFDNPTDAYNWVESHKKFTNCMVAYENGGQIQFSVNDAYEWQDIAKGVAPLWNLTDGYRIKPDDESYCYNCGYCTESLDFPVCAKCKDYSNWIPKDCTSKHRMTYRELARWFSEGKGEVLVAGKCRTSIGYLPSESNTAVKKEFKIRSFDSDKWCEPEIEV